MSKPTAPVFDLGKHAITKINVADIRNVFFFEDDAHISLRGGSTVSVPHQLALAMQAVWSEFLATKRAEKTKVA